MLSNIPNYSRPNPSPAGALLTGVLTVLFAFVVSLTLVSAQGLTINTVAGGSTPTGPAPNGFAGDGTLATSPSVRLAQPYGVAVDSVGNIYIADTVNHRIRKVRASDGFITTIAGTGEAGFFGDGGEATLAKLNFPLDVAVDGSGNLYVSDQNNNRIRKITAAGFISTLAGSAEAGYSGDNGPATSATLNRPFGVAVNSSGTIVYFADTGNSRIRKVTNNTITLFAGTGYLQPDGTSGFSGENVDATSARLNQPQGVEVDNAGIVFIADTLNNVVRKVATNGIITTVAGIPPTPNVPIPNSTAYTQGGYNGEGSATSAKLHFPYSVAVDSGGNLLIADYFNYRIRKVTSGVISTVAGNGQSGYDGDGGSSTAAFISDPAGVSVDSSGDFYIVDQSSNRIRKVFPTPPPPTAEAPSITLHPSNVFTIVGGAATFQANASGTPAPTVQWQVSSNGGTTFTNLAGQTGNILSFGATQADNGKRYRAVFTNIHGTATTNSALLTVRPAPRPPTDLDGDGIGDLTVWRPGNGTWFTLTSSTGYAYEAQRANQWGNQSHGDVPLMGDLDGDQLADLVIWRASTGTWFWLLSSASYSPASAGVKQWGNENLGDIPMLAEMDGDGKMDLVLWRQSDGTWYWLTSSTNYSHASYGAKQWGNQGLGDIPKVADIDGDGKAELIVWRASTGTWFWLTSVSGYDYSSMVGKQWGNQSLGDVPLIGDIDGDGKTELVVWRASTGTWFWLTSTTNYAATAGLQWGNQGQGDIPLLTDLDGDGKVDLTVWRAPSGTWFWLKSTMGYGYDTAGAKQWGSQANGDIPIVK